jgi:hypothetical protein
VANSFALFKLPRVKEILGRPINDFTQRSDVDVLSIPYADKNQGKQFQSKAEKRKEKFDKKMEVNMEREVKIEKAEVLKKSSKSVRNRHRKEMDWEEWDELAAETREMKKEKKAQKKFKDKM